MYLYKKVLKPLLFKVDPEFIHDRFVMIGRVLGSFYITKKACSLFFAYQNKSLEQDILGIHFKNPIGLSAGFDKNAEITDILPSVGFGYVEVGSITGNVCLGNPKPRLWRLKNSQGLVVHYGLKNDGCEAIAQRLQKKLQKKSFEIPVGMSVAMTNCQENLTIENAIEDYAKAFKTLEPFGAYITVNISCPNTLGGQPFVEPEKLTKLLTTLDAIPTQKPIFIKFSPDMSDAELDALLDVAANHRVHGIICTNLTKKRDNPSIFETHVPEKGGMSGKIVQDMSDNMLAHIYRRKGKRFILVGSGGVFSAEDAYRKIRLGASLIQLITGMIFEGPQLIGVINKGLAELLKRDGFTNISEAIGVDNKI